MNNNVIITAGGNQPVYDFTVVARKVNELLTSVTSEAYATINPKEDDELSYPYAIFDLDVEAIGDDQRAEGFYIDIELFDRSSSYTGLYELDSKFKNLLDKLRLLNDDCWYMFKWNRTSQVPTEQRGLLRLASQYYIKVETRKRV